MSNLQQEREHLALAEHHIAAGERRLAQQIALIEQMTREGHDTILAKEFLKILEQTLEEWRVHRQLIVDTIARH